MSVPGQAKHKYTHKVTYTNFSSTDLAFYAMLAISGIALLTIILCHLFIDNKP